jgi:hypothetical protein
MKANFGEHWRATYLRLLRTAGLEETEVSRRLEEAIAEGAAAASEEHVRGE